MSRTHSVVKNAVWELGYYLIVITLGFLAPRYIILIYGSEVNGLSSTITQILNVLLVLQAGATTAAVFSLYKPIADNNLEEISKNIYIAEKFFKKISYIFTGIMLLAAVFTAIFINSNLERFYVFIAFVIMGFKSFLDLYFTSKFRIVFTAYQEKFVISIATLIEQIAYYALIFLTLYFRVHFVFIYVWFFVGCVAKIIYLNIKFRRKYGKIIPQYMGAEPGQIKGKSYAFANEVAHCIVSSSIAIILSFMYGLQETSVYSVYALVSQALTLVATSLYSAFGPSFGNLVAANSKDNAQRVFGIFQYIYVAINTVMFCCMIVLVAPFAKIYTSGATDICYENVTLACMLGLSCIFSAYRIPYNIIVSSCGFFKETWKQPVICTFVSFLFSVVGGLFDYSFIVLGPVFFYLINFLYQHFRIKDLAPHLISAKVFVMFGISMAGFVISVTICNIFPMQDGIVSWLIFALTSILVSVSFVIVSSLILLPKEFKATFDYVKVHFIRRLVNV